MTEVIRWSTAAADSLIGRYPQLPEHPLLADCWNYESGCLLKAIEQVYEATGDERYLAYIRCNVDRYVREDGSIRSYLLEDYNLDQINMGKVLFGLYRRTRDEKYRMAYRLLFAQLEGQPRTDEGSFWHKKVYPFQVWLDGLYMSAPFLAEYALVEQKPELWDDAARQLLMAERRTRNPATGLLHHAYDESREQEWANPEHGRSPHAWGRAIGWYMMAIVDVLDYLPRNHGKRGQLIGVFERLFGALERVQDPLTGLWSQVLGEEGRAGNYKEASCSAMIVYSARKARNRGYLSARYEKAVDKGYQGLLKHVVEMEEDGHVVVSRINRVAGLGGVPYRDGSYTYYVNEQVCANDAKGYAPFIMACVEHEREHGADSYGKRGE